ncbi:hypothetical protein LTS14_009646 [Recurvomyces mirabilis]|uniref:uncharacterized protein n=1 Tax=Recurvomyces mirabilis TaxID=574656 RepID=UPI002DDE32E8|nr:hypothetical protein LTS14_009646 [Recurvomyces mirabilis]
MALGEEMMMEKILMGGSGMGGGIGGGMGMGMGGGNGRTNGWRNDEWYGRRHGRDDDPQHGR